MQEAFWAAQNGQQGPNLPTLDFSLKPGETVSLKLADKVDIKLTLSLHWHNFQAVELLACCTHGLQTHQLTCRLCAGMHLQRTAQLAQMYDCPCFRLYAIPAALYPSFLQSVHHVLEACPYASAGASSQELLLQQAAGCSDHC